MPRHFSRDSTSWNTIRSGDSEAHTLLSPALMECLVFLCQGLSLFWWGCGPSGASLMCSCIPNLSRESYRNGGIVLYIYSKNPLLTAANQKEPMNLNFKVKEEPKDEETPSVTLPRSSLCVQPRSEVSAASISEDTLSPRKQRATLPRSDRSVKAASELLMKLSGIWFSVWYSHTDTITCKPTGLPMGYISLLAAISHY